MNKVTLFGRIANEIKTSEYGKKNDKKTLARFTIAVRRDVETADFISCVAFGRTAELIEEYFDKGKQILVAGRLQTGSYEDKDGVTRYTTDVIVDQLDFISDGSNDSSKSKKKKKKKQEDDEDEDD